MPNVSGDACGFDGDAAMSNMGGPKGQTALVEVFIYAAGGEWQRAGASIRGAAGQVLASVAFACPTH
jgi:hypothetical protein